MQTICTDDDEEAGTTIEPAQRPSWRQALWELLRICLRELWCAAEDLVWAGSAVRGSAGGKWKLMQNGHDRRTRNVSFFESRCSFLFINTDLIDGNAGASICTKCGHAANREQHFCGYAAIAETLAKCRISLHRNGMN